MPFWVFFSLFQRDSPISYRMIYIEGQGKVDDYERRKTKVLSKIR